MKNILLKNLLSKIRRTSSQLQHSEAGFTLLELTVIVIIIGVFSAIAAPAWDAFVTRQRIRTINNQVLRTLQTAQAEAKLRKQNLSVTFAYIEDDDLNDPPRYTLHLPTTTIEDSDKRKELITGKAGIIENWQDFGIEGEIPSNVIKLTMHNIPVGQFSLDNAIPFTDQGAVDIDRLKQDGGDLPIAVIVSTPEDQSKRCVIVQTLLGAMRTAEGNACP